MQLLVFGASGRVGRRVCEYANSDGHGVTAFVHAADRAPSGVGAVEGDVCDGESVSAAVADHGAVCYVVGPDDDERPSVLPDGIENVVPAMADAGIDRLVGVAADGILQATPNRLRLDTPEFPAGLRRVATAHRDAYERLRESTLDWTLACPPRMPDGTPTNHYRTAVDYLPEGGQSISTGDVAAFVYDAAVRGGHHRERVGIAY